MYTINEIESTLKYGKVLSKKRMAVSRVLISFLLIISALVMLSIIFLFIDHLKSKELIYMSIVLMFAIALTIISIFYYIRNIKFNKEIELWLNDAEEYYAKVKRLDINDRKYQMYQISVTFKIDNTNITKISKRFNYIVDPIPKIFSKYHNKKIKILYSKKFDQIIIPKQDI